MTKQFHFSIVLTLGFILAFLSPSLAQDSTKHQKHQMLGLPLVPEFPGGKDSLTDFLKKNVRYPASAMKHHISGTIEVDFWIDEKGNLSNLHVLKSLGYGCDKEALRVVKMMPKWKPGMQGRNPMAMDYHVNITFAPPEKK